MNANVNVAELVAQLPLTDKQVEGKNTNVAASKFTGPDPQALTKLIEQVLAGGRDAVVELARLVKDRASPDYKSYRAEYLLHALVLHVGQPQQAEQRKLVVESLGSLLADQEVTPYLRGLLIRELQWCGNESALATISKLLTDKQFCRDAVAAMTAIGGPPAMEQLCAAYPKADADCRLPILHALAALRDKAAAGLFRTALTDEQEDMQLTGAWGAARVADSAAAAAMLKLAEVPLSYARTKAAAACLQLAEGLAAGDKAAATDVYKKLRETRLPGDEQAQIEAIERALAALAG